VDKKLLLDKIAASRREVDAAEKKLAIVLRATTKGLRAEKTTVTETVKEAMAKLRTARTDLEDLGRIVSDKG
jgi:hypothetical protein